MILITTTGTFGNELELLPSAVRNATLNSPDLRAVGASLILFLNITAVTAAQTVRARVAIRDPSSGVYAVIADTPQLGAIGLNVLMLAPGAAAVANQIIALPVPRLFRIQMEHSGSGNFTYSLGASCQ